MPAFDSAGIKVFALSYDEPDALRDFRDAHKITYALLSDPESRVISALGILNTLIHSDDHPWYGIPYPGTYVLDASGHITHKFFENNLAVRAGPEQLLKAAEGKADTEDSVDAQSPTTSPRSVEISVYLEGKNLTPTVQRDLVVSFKVPAGRHVYAAPAPEGSVAVNVILDAQDRLVQRPLIHPPSETHRLNSTGEVFEVHHHRFELRIPLTINGVARDTDSIQVSGEVFWQACDDEVCDIPTSERFSLEMPVAPAPDVALGNGTGAALEPNAMAHFKKMSERRTKTS